MQRLIPGKVHRRFGHARVSDTSRRPTTGSRHGGMCLSGRQSLRCGNEAAPLAGPVVRRGRQRFICDQRQTAGEVQAVARPTIPRNDEAEQRSEGRYTALPEATKVPSAPFLPTPIPASPYQGYVKKTGSLTCNTSTTFVVIFREKGP